MGWLAQLQLGSVTVVFRLSLAVSVVHYLYHIWRRSQTTIDATDEVDDCNQFTVTTISYNRYL
ncbi:hypothetical protein BDR04DRAFT_1101437 [Suillus decipiens]|nr:hypothetical protein BDR04DRAFT_1101437 [Suillus decipiens]